MQVEEVRAVRSSTTCGGCRQWCPSGPSQYTKFRLARGRESRDGQRMADVLFPPHSGCRAFVLDGTKRLQDCRSSRSYRILRDRMRVSTPELATEQHKICKPSRAGNGANVDNDLASNGAIETQLARPQQRDVDG